MARHNGAERNRLLILNFVGETCECYLTFSACASLQVLQRILKTQYSTVDMILKQCCFTHTRTVLQYSVVVLLLSINTTWAKHLGFTSAIGTRRKRIAEVPKTRMVAA